MTAKYFADSAKYQITLNRKEAEALAYYGSSYDYLITALKLWSDEAAELKIFVDNKFTVMADLNRALAASRNFKEGTAMKNVLVDMLKAQGFTDAQSMEFACEHTLLSKKYEKQVQTCWYGEQTSTLEVKLFVNLEAGVCRAWFYSDGRRDAYKERWYSTLGKRTYNAIAETVKNAGFEI